MPDPWLRQHKNCMQNRYFSIMEGRGVEFGGKLCYIIYEYPLKEYFNHITVGNGSPI